MIAPEDKVRRTRSGPPRIVKVSGPAEDKVLLYGPRGEALLITRSRQVGFQMRDEQ